MDDILDQPDVPRPEPMDARLDEALPTHRVADPEHGVSSAGGGGGLAVVPERSGGPFPGLRRRLSGLGTLFWLVVVMPSLAAFLYFGLLASDVYVSESRFVVRSPDKPQKAGLGVLLSSAGFANASEEVRAALGFIESRDGLKTINRDDLARNAWGSQSVSIFNRFDPLGWSGSFEELYKFYTGKVVADYDPETGITTLTVRAFNPKDAQAMNARLLTLAEALVNRLNNRGSADLVRYAEREVEEARAQASQAALELANYRNRAGVIDPERQATVQLQMISKLQDELIGARMQVLQLSSAAAQNPQIPLLRVRIRGLEKAIQEQLGEVAGNKGSLSEAAAQYQRLQVQREFADQQLGLSLSALQEARNEARRQRAYVERVAEPSMPDDALEPRRVRGILSTIIIALAAWGILSMLLAGVREHRD
jgi:capsular polysaccharide transport system permease protein